MREIWLRLQARHFGLRGQPKNETFKEVIWERRNELGGKRVSMAEKNGKNL